MESEPLNGNCSKPILPRPPSLYDNFLENTNKRNSNQIEDNTNNKELIELCEKNPTQKICLNTTVPQNIAGLKIAGKHTPTRNSLRHSRMIVLNRHGKVPRRNLPALLRYRNVVKALLLFVCILGVVLCVLSFWALLWAPNLRIQDNPYWSAIPVIISGIIGLLYMMVLPKQFPDWKNSYWTRSLKYASIAASGIATISAFIMTILTILHLVFVYITNCFPANSLESSCICSFDNSSIVSTNETTTTPFVPFLLPESYHYIDLTCSEIDNLLKFVLIIVCSANFLSIATNGIYLLLHWNSRNHNYHTFIYSKVQTNNNSTYNDLSVPVTS